ncbi:MAG: succinate dehydrogenase assembly factor 2 [Betaproteobacteria bacterium]|jgi:antitoxin CptB|nr:succinate dehydrogenase assembly factor 2 [Betaproteobacteria bacterium]MDH4294206.1 succinate dehydrogenase assembly factor 2 [Betaproteobacteria bacterium]
MAEVDRIRWQCRRGLLELDLMLNRFLDRELAGLGPEELLLFKELLNEADTLLLAWVMGQEQPPGRYQVLIRRLQQVSMDYL